MAGGAVSGEAYGHIIDTLSFLLTVLPWLTRLAAGRRTVIHGLLAGDGGQTWYVCRILRRRVLSVADDVMVHVSRPLKETVDYHHNGLHLTTSENRGALQVKSNSQLQPGFEYYVGVRPGDPGTALLPSDRQGGVTLVLKDEWTSRMRRVRCVSGVAAGLLALGALLAYFGWIVTPNPSSVLSTIGAFAALIAGTPGWRASRSLERTRAWFNSPPISP